MRRIFLFMLFVACSLLANNQVDSQIWGADRITNIERYEQFGILSPGPLFVTLQNQYFAIAFLIVLIAVPAVFSLHYMIIGPKIFSHAGKKIYAFSVFTRIIHWIAAFAWIMLVPTGFIMIFGDFFGGGVFVRFAKNLHGIATVMFAVSVLPMFLIWFKRMLPTTDDIKWMLILGGYLSKEIKPIPAGKFNCGQKMWYWLATLGGIVMILTGAAMFFLDFNFVWLREITGLSQIQILRICAITHNVLGMAVTALFFTHVYMSMFAIKGAIHSIIDGYKEEDEVKYLHSSWYKELKSKGKI